MISKHLAYHIKNTNIDDKVSYAKSAHASGLIGLVTTCFNTNVALVTETMKQMLDAASIKWFSQLTNITSFKVSLNRKCLCKAYEATSPRLHCLVTR